MTTINYTIEFLSEWHIGSGLGTGAEFDAALLKDRNGLPYIPGKTIKGLFRQAAEEISSVQGSKVSNYLITEIFGDKTEDKTKAATAFFGNVDMISSEYNEIIENALQEHLFSSFARTKINTNGIASDKSLRTIEVCMPITLEGCIELADESHINIIEMCAKWTRAIGVNRNRGLGKCKINLKK